jgi:hypothetical protein
MGIPVGNLSSWGTGIGTKCLQQAFVGIPTEKFLCCGNGYGEIFPNGEFPIAIAIHKQLYFKSYMLLNCL